VQELARTRGRTTSRHVAVRGGSKAELHSRVLAARRVRRCQRSSSRLRARPGGGPRRQATALHIHSEVRAQLAALLASALADGGRIAAAMDGAAEVPVMNSSAENGPSIARGAGSGRNESTPACAMSTTSLLHWQHVQAVSPQS
jgi:hypothetical protein